MRNQALVSLLRECCTGLPHRARLEPLNQDAVEERHNSLDTFESCLGSLQDALTTVSLREVCHKNAGYRTIRTKGKYKISRRVET